MIISYEIIFLLTLLFCVLAFLHSSIGLGGGTSYSAILLVVGINYTLVPSLSLSLNLIVSALGLFNFLKAKHFYWRHFLPFIISSIPATYYGSLLVISSTFFITLVIICLIFMLIILQLPLNYKLKLTPFKRVIISLIIGSLLGFFSGIIGIGGGIFLIPLLVILGLASIHQAAAYATVFIFINSFIGLLSRFLQQKLILDFSLLAPLLCVVIIGGYLGSFLGANKFPSKILKNILSLTLFFIICFLLKRTGYSL